MTTTEFLSHLRSLNVRLWADGERLRCNAPKEVLTPELWAELRDRKQDILAFLREANGAAYSSVRSIQPVSRNGDLPLSFAQQRLWFLDQLEPNSTVYNERRVLRLMGPLDVEALQNTLQAIVSRHEVLRTTFAAADGIPVQVIAPPDRPAELRMIDLTQVAADGCDEEVQRLLREESSRPFNLSADLMLRVTLLKLEQEEHILILVMHHIASDGWSMKVLLQELAALYREFSTGKPSPLLELPIQYADYAVWQRQWLQGEVLDSQVRYWKKKLADAPALLELPTDRPRPPVQSYRGGRQSLWLSEAASEALKSLSRRERVTLFMALLAAFKVFLYRYTGQDDIVVGSPTAGRNRIETEGLIGFFVNNLVLRTDLSGDPSFRELLGRVRETALGAYAHQDLPFEKLVEELQPKRTLDHHPLFQLVFALETDPGQVLDMAGLTTRPMGVQNDTAKFDLTLLMTDTGKELIATLEYNTDLFAPATIGRMLGHFQTLLQSIAANPEQRLSDLPILTQREKQQLLSEWNTTPASCPENSCIHELFEEQVERTADAVAVVFEDKSLTYRELNRRANQLAHYLQKIGVGPDVPVAICMERSLEMVIGLIGALKAGGAYLPLDPAYPKERVAFVLNDSQASVLVTQKRFLDKLPEHRCETICFDVDWELGCHEPDENPIVEVKAENLAYMIYTSGSTGRPKGVAVPHRAVNRLVINTDYVNLEPTDVIAHVSHCSFDAATFEIWGALLHGAKLVGIATDIVLSPDDFAAQIERNKISVLFLTTVMFNQMARECPAAFKHVRHLLFGGEAADPRSVSQILKHGRPERLLHVYGPTETTTFATWYLVENVAEGETTIPIGRPIANTQIYLLDGHLRPVPVGVVGELYIGGDGLARGYINSPELTAERFIPHPFSDEPGARLYKSGDLGRYLPDGSIQFIGRIDHQVKIRGFRIEPGEIEAVLSQHPAVAEAVVLSREKRAGEKQLAAYVVPSQNHAPTTQELRQFLQEKLPEYMIPSLFHLLEFLPLTPNGKIDRRALPAPTEAKRDNTPDYAAPTNSVEHQLVQIWEELLGVKPIGIRDNFFDLGGHSLLAVQMMHQVEKVCGEKLPLSALLAGPMIDHLGEALARRRIEGQESVLVKIQSGGNKQPFFFLQGEFRSGGFYCLNLARGLGEERPFYVLMPHGINGAPETVPNIIEAMAAAYIEVVRTAQPEGPYLLGGFCNGGLIAFEMARQLQARGEKVDLVMMIAIQGQNAPGMRLLQQLVFGMGRLLGVEAERTMRLFAVLRYYLCRLKAMAQAPFTEQVAWAVRVLKRAVSGSPRKVAAANERDTFVGVDGAEAQQARKEDALVKLYGRAVSSYVPRPYPGRVVLFWPIEEDSGNPRDPSVGWGEAAPNIEVQEVPGEHVTCITTYVQTLAEKMKACMEEVQAREEKGTEEQRFGPERD